MEDEKMLQTGYGHPSVSLVDSHCHLDMDDYRDDLDAVLARAAENRVETVITIGIDLPSSRAAVELARRYPQVKATVGIHPHNCYPLAVGSYDELAALARKNPDLVVGLGEIGLDLAKLYAPVEAQRQSFHRQLDLARELELPVVIHDRDAHAETLAVLREHAPFAKGGVMHCYSGDLALARQVLDLGLEISIPGIVTFKNAVRLREVAREIPLSRLLLETDGPFLAPAPRRGTRNEPALLVHTAAMVADLRQVSLDEVAGRTSENARRLFRLALPGGQA